MIVAGYLIFLATCYGVIGAAVAVAFLLIGIDRVDESARGVYAFRPLLIPGLVLLWPLVLVRWRAMEQQRFAQNQKVGHE